MQVVFKAGLTVPPFMYLSPPPLLPSPPPPPPPLPLQITKAYITSRLESLETLMQDNLDNPLDDKTMVAQQLCQMATIGRYVGLRDVLTVSFANCMCLSIYSNIVLVLV